MEKSPAKASLSVKEMVVFSLLGAIMFISKQLLEFLPNIHMLGMLTMVYTLVYRKKALIPIYLFVLLEGVIAGFSLWWIPYIYIWAVLWLVTMLLPKGLPDKIAIPVYAVICALHGLCYGTLYAPFQALMMGLTFKGMVTWIIAGLPWDAVHAAGNLVFGTLIVPLCKLLCKLNTRIDNL